MKYVDSVEAQIQEAIKRGDFDNLANKGKPLDLSAWQKTPEHLRMAYSILKNSGYTPAEVQTRKEIAVLRKLIERETDAEKKRQLTEKLRAFSITNAVQAEKRQEPS